MHIDKNNILYKLNALADFLDNNAVYETNEAN